MARLIESDDKSIRFELNGTQYTFQVAQNGANYFTHNEDVGNLAITEKDRFPSKKDEKAKGGYIAPMPSQIVKILVEEGQEVKSGDSLIVITSMKMENTIAADEDGVVEAIFTNEGANVEAGFLLIQLKSEA